VRPDVTLVDLRMPGMGSVEAIRALRREFPDSRLIVLTTYDGDEDIYRALEAGAQAYLLKDMLCDKILGAITPSLTACQAADALGDANANNGTCGAWAIDGNPISATRTEAAIAPSPGP
jgi:DNA-binding NarL/FixJ family response regulator